MINSYHSYSIQNQLNGWTRVDMLIAIYNRTIVAIQSMAAAENSDPRSFGGHYLDVQKCLLAIHAGLKPEEEETAFNVARLIHYVSVLLQRRDYSNAVRILETLRDGFEAVREDATRLELEGKIPPLELTTNYSTLV
jgi:hypothetical protein